jgi:hypothetical protein
MRRAGPPTARTNHSRATGGRLLVAVGLSVLVVLSSAAVGSVAAHGSDSAMTTPDATATDTAVTTSGHSAGTRSEVGAHIHARTVAPHARAQTTNGTPSDDAAVAIREGDTYYVGQTLRRSRGVPADERLDLRRVGRLDSVVFSTSQGVTRIDTTGLAVGQYSLRAPNGTEIVSFRLVRQTVDVAFGSSTVSNAGGGTGTALTVSTNRRSPVYYVTASVDGERLDADEIRRLFGGTGTTLAPDVLRVTGTTSESFTLNASGVEEGRLTLTATAPDTGANDSATITVEARGNGSALFSPRVVQATAGDVVTLGVTFDRTDRATLTVGTAPVNYRVTMTVVDGDGDGEATIRWDTSRAGQGAATDAFAAGDADDSVRNVSRSTGPLSESLAADTYATRLVVDGRETDVGTVSLRDPETPRPCGRNGAALVDRYHDNLDSVPSLAEGMLTDETIHLLVNGDEGGEYTVVTDTDMRVTTFQRGEPADATMVVETDCETVRTVLDASNPADAFATAYNDGEITVSGATFVKSVVVEASKLLFDIGRSLGLF